MTDTQSIDPFSVPEDAPSNFNVPTYEIAPEDQAIANEILGMDPLSLPSGVEAVGDVKVPEPTLGSLPKHLQAPILDKLKDVPLSIRAERERELVLDTLRQQRFANMHRTGFGASVPLYWREKAALAAEFDRNAREIAYLQSRLDEADTAEIRIDPATGEERAFPILKLKCPVTRAGYERRIDELVYHNHLLSTTERERREAAALVRDVADIKAARAQLAERAEAKKLAEETLRRERIQNQADSIVRMGRNAL